MRKSFVSAPLIAALFCTPGNGAAPAPVCSGYLGTTVAPLTFEQAVAKLPKVAPKGEFETTAQYEERKAAAGGNDPLIISKQPEDRRYFSYDADTQKLTIQSYAFDNTSFDAWRALYHTDAEGLDPSTMDNVDVVIDQARHFGGSYIGQNGFGARAKITEMELVVHAIFDHPISIDDHVVGRTSFFVADDGTLDLTPSEAQALKPKLKIAFVAKPKAPFLVHNHYTVGEPTLESPYDETVQITVLIADLQCGLLLDGSNKVLGAYPIR